MQSQYVNELDETKAKFEEEDSNQTGNESTYELKYFKDRRFEAWDAHLNEIYSVLKANLPADQFDQLKGGAAALDQVPWRKYKVSF